MLNKIYCTECGNPTETHGVTIKFCSSCGHSFLTPVLSSIDNKINTNLNKTKFGIVEEDNNDTIDNLTLLKIDKLELSELSGERSKKLTFGDLALSPKTEDNSKLVRPPQFKGKYNKKKFQEQYFLEAGGGDKGRSKSISIGDE